MLGFDKLVTTSEIVPLEELKERFLIMITRIKHLPTPSSRDEIRAAKTYEELY